jgi:hypothetical protein
MADKVQKPVTVQCPNPAVEGASGTVKQTREMEMGVTIIKGQPIQIHKYIREDY